MFLQASAIVTAGNTCAYLLQLLLARGLAPADFGAVNALLALSILMVAPLTVVQATFSKALIDDGVSGAHFSALARRMMLGSWLAAAALVLVYLPFAPGVQRAFDVSWMAAWVLLPALVAATFLYHVPLGIWQGRKNHLAVAFAMASVPVVRLVCGAALIAAGAATTLTALGALTAGALALVIGGALLQRGHLLSRDPAPAGWSGRMVRFGLSAMLATTGLLALAYADLPVVRAISSAEMSGQYAAASMLARIAYILPIALVNVVFPEAAVLARDKPDGRESLALIGGALGLSALIGGGAVAVMAIAPGLCLSLLVGPQYVEAAPLLRIVAPSMALLACVTLVCNYALARNSYALCAPVALAAPVFVAAALWRQSSPFEVALLLLGVVTLLAATCVAWLFVKHGARRSSGPAL